MSRKQPDTIGFAVVGLGMGGRHCEAILEAKGAALVALCDKHPERLEQRVEEFGVPGYVKYQDLLKDPHVDVVSIATESGNHAHMGIAAVRAGKHIIVEKPVDITPSRIDALQREVERAGVKCGCIFQSRVSPCNIAIKQSIEKGKMGRIIGLHGSLPWYRGPEYFSGPFGPWRGTWKLDGGGSMMNQGIHTVDLLIFFGGRIKRVNGFFGVFDHAIEAEDHAVGCLEFENGALGTIFTTTCARPEGAQQIYGFGTKGSFKKEGEALLFYEMGSTSERAKMMARFGNQRTQDAAAKDPMAVQTYGHRLLMEDMVQAIRMDREPIIPLHEARHAVEVVCGIYKAAQTGKTVTLL